MKPSEWLSTLNSHSIYTANGVQEDFEKSVDFPVEVGVGELPLWPIHSVSATRQAIEERGIGGYIDDGGDVAYGYEIARAVEKRFLGTDNGGRYQGRGSQFRAAIEALQSAGM